MGSFLNERKGIGVEIVILSLPRLVDYFAVPLWHINSFLETTGTEWCKVLLTNHLSSHPCKVLTSLHFLITHNFLDTWFFFSQYSSGLASFLYYSPLPSWYILQATYFPNRPPPLFFFLQLTWSFPYNDRHQTTLQHLLNARYCAKSVGYTRFLL